MIEVELVEEGIMYEGELFRPPRPSKSWVAQFSRFLLKKGLNPQTLVRVHRKGQRVFLDRTLEAWGGVTTREVDYSSIKFIPYVPLEYKFNGKT